MIRDLTNQQQLLDDRVDEYNMCTVITFFLLLVICNAIVLSKFHFYLFVDYDVEIRQC